MQLMGLPMQFRAPYMPWVRRVPESTLVLPHCTLEYRRVPYLTHPCGILDYHTVPYSTGVPACLGALRSLFPDGREPGRGPARHRRRYRPCLASPCPLTLPYPLRRTRVLQLRAQATSTTSSTTYTRTTRPHASGARWLRPKSCTVCSAAARGGGLDAPQPHHVAAAAAAAAVRLRLFSGEA